VAYFDQKKDQLDLSKSLLENISGGQTHVELNGQKKHAISYLQDFLFSSERIQTPVKHFSGGEKQRALLAKLFLKPANVYILDEPTNDLDLDTLDALEQFLVETKSAILLVSHDRAFINQIATQVLYFDDTNQITEYAGGYDDALTQGAKPIALMQEANAKKPTKAPKNKDHRAIRRVLDKIKRLEKQIEDQSNLLTQPDVFNDFEKVKTIQLTLKTLEADKDAAYDAWLELEDD